MVSNTTIIREIAKEISDFSRGFIRGFIESHLMIPTAFRKHVSEFPSPKDKERYMDAYRYGSFLPILTTTMMGAYPAMTYFLLYKYNFKYTTPLLITQISTNALSGFYEYFQYKKREHVKKSTPPSSRSKIPAHVPSNLETKVQISAIEEIIHPQEPLDPWSIEIPRIEEKK